MTDLLTQLRKYMNDVLLDQIPNLALMLRSLEELSMMSVPSNLSMSSFAVQQVPILKSSIHGSRTQQDWSQLAQLHYKRLTTPVDEEERGHIKRLADLYTNTNVQGLVAGFKCSKCNKEAFKRCSKCKEIWYCTRECQVAHWPTHKKDCQQRVAKKAQNQKVKEEESQATEKQALRKKPLIDELD